MSKLIQSIFDSREFNGRLNRAEGISKETSLETGFYVQKKFMEGLDGNPNPDYKVGEIMLGEDENCLADGNDIADFSTGLYNFMFVHFHGDFDRYFIPSPSDFAIISKRRRELLQRYAINAKPVMITASHKQRKTYFAIVQETAKEPLPVHVIFDFVERYQREIAEPFLAEFINPRNVQAFINKSGLYKCRIVEFYENSKIRIDERHRIDEPRLAELVEKFKRKSKSY
ncbi:hypothetical protein KY343_06065 [Candidatus Woesearchaeota archaeon]|nr:hypothetical protein [Candidatus Woesearchaeota archaeon]